MRASARLHGAIVALVEVAQNGKLSANSAGALEKASNALPEPKTAPTMTIYKKGGRVILRCSSIREKAEALKEANRDGGFWGDAKQAHYQESVSKPEWIVVPSHIERSTLGSPRSKVVTFEMPAPTPEDWFSVIAYARLNAGRQPKGSEGLSAFRTETGTLVGSYGLLPFVLPWVMTRRL